MPLATLEVVTNFLSKPGIPETAVANRIVGLEKRYGEPWRHHHVFEHPLELFDILIAHLDVVRDPEVVGWSMLDHDAVYDPMSEHGRNEELSALLAEHELPDIIGHRKSGLVASYTRATAQHNVAEIDPDLDFFLDADILILGSSADRYDRYARNIRLEYAHVPDDQYRLGRIAILEGLATRVEEAGLFKTELFRETYENQAQENIASEIDRLWQAV